MADAHKLKGGSLVSKMRTEVSLSKVAEASSPKKAVSIFEPEEPEQPEEEAPAQAKAKTFRNVLTEEEDETVLTKLARPVRSVAHLEAQHAALMREGDELMEKGSTGDALAKYDEAAALENEITTAQKREAAAD